MPWSSISEKNERWKIAVFSDIILFSEKRGRDWWVHFLNQVHSLAEMLMVYPVLREVAVTTCKMINEFVYETGFVELFINACI